MRMKKYTIGIDFGTLSGRALLINALTGEEVAEAVLEYRHGVMDEQLPGGRRLPGQYALQHPADYLSALESAVRGAMEKSGAEYLRAAGRKDRTHLAGRRLHGQKAMAA